MQNQERQFYQILTKVGSNHRYQTILTIIVILFAYSIGSTFFYNVFLFYENEYQCPSQIDNCTQFVCTLPEEERKAYIDPSFSSLITQYGDFRCTSFSSKDQAQSIIYIGGLVGILLNVYLDQKFTKWYIMFVCGFIEMGCVCLTFIAPTITFATVTLFLNLATHNIIIQILPSIIIQSIDESVRQDRVILMSTVLAIGTGLNGPLFKYLPWKIVLLIENIIPVIIALILMYFYMQETPFQLIINYQPEESKRALKHISQINGMLQLDASITIQQLANIKKQYNDNNEKHQIQEISLWDLCKYDSLRMGTILLSALNFAVGYQFDASELSLANYSISIYYSGTLFGFSGIIATILCSIILQNYKRKSLMIFTQCLCFISAILVFIFAPCNNQQPCSPDKLLFQTIGLIIFRFFNTIYVNVFFIYASQFLPNQIRVKAMVVVFLSFQVGIIIIPLVQSYLKTIKVSITIIFAIMSIVTILLQIPLKQTFGIPPPQIIQELKYKHKPLNHQQLAP